MIDFPRTINGLDFKDLQYNNDKNIGRIVSVKYKGENYKGVYLGELPWLNVARLDTESKLTIEPMYNPAIYVEDLKRIVFGYESFWSFEDIEITDDIIKDQWYMKAVDNVK